ncbi:MAG: hypothetical protein ABIO70_20240 [Pseudomonadota bacterium]
MSGTIIPLPNAADIHTLATALDAASEEERLGWLARLPRNQLGVLFDLAAGQQHSVEAMHAREGEVVVHQGINSAPSFRHFQKRLVLHGGQVKGYNHQPFSWLVGAGSFVVEPSTEVSGEVLFDYTGLPREGFPAFPTPKPNTAGLSRFVYGDMIDVVRRVSAHVSIGKAYRRGEYAGFHFALCRRTEP